MNATGPSQGASSFSAARTSGTDCKNLHRHRSMFLLPKQLSPSYRASSSSAMRPGHRSSNHCSMHSATSSRPQGLVGRACTATAAGAAEVLDCRQRPSCWSTNTASFSNTGRSDSSGCIVRVSTARAAAAAGPADGAVAEQVSTSTDCWPQGAAVFSAVRSGPSTLAGRGLLAAQEVAADGVLLEVPLHNTLCVFENDEAAGLEQQRQCVVCWEHRHGQLPGALVEVLLSKAWGTCAHNMVGGTCM